MEKINVEQFANLKQQKRGRKSKSKWPSILDVLGLHEGYIIKKEDWDLKSSVSSAIGSYCFHKHSSLYGKKFKMKTLPDKTGWAILRVQ